MKVRNVAIIAHVDHGKTTLVDQMLRQAGVFRENQQVRERVMDSNPLERERGITILSKNTSVRWGEFKINIVDTPGHADFGGEVERILRMVDGVLLLDDAAEGPMPQTRFVTAKALELGHAPVVVINKADRPDARAEEVHDEVLELFMDLEASDDQLDAPFMYASGREGWATPDADGRGADLAPLFAAVVDHVPAPPVEPAGPFQMLVSTLDHSSYVGRIAIGRVERGRIRPGQEVALLPMGVAGMVEEDDAARSRALKVYGFDGLERVDIAEAGAGDIVAVAGVSGVEIGRTLADPEHLERLSGIAVERPTISVDFVVNDSPFSGEGKYVTTRQLRERLFREMERNVALKVEATDHPDTFRVAGRGELHLSILMETMRREGYEFQVSRPRVLMREGPAGEALEPYEELVAETPEARVGTVIEKLGARRGEMLEMRPTGRGPIRLRFRIPARGLFGYRTEFLTDTRGDGLMHHRFLEYGPWAGALPGRERGAVVADRRGVAVAYAIFGLQERATFFLGPGAPVYEGMIAGVHVRAGDLDVNMCKGKKLTNIRAAASDDNIRLEPPRIITLESALEFIADDEFIEVTPVAIRLRKRILDAGARRKAARRRR
ncbi:MAG: translational GTPase TypA [Gammaproteobacteria bacterium]|nr:translational GTPase TypA [Gammaproteobacteria bacterium]